MRGRTSDLPLTLGCRQKSRGDQGGANSGNFVVGELAEWRAHGGMRELASHKDTVNQLKNGAFDKEYESPAATPASAGAQPPALPLGADGILAFRINANRPDQGGLTLQLLPEQGPGLNLNLNRTMLFMLYNLLEQGLVQAHWNIHLPQTHTEPVH